MARRGPVRGPSHPCKGCNERYRRHGSVASVQLARRLQEAVLLIIRRSWVRAPPAPLAVSLPIWLEPWTRPCRGWYTEGTHRATAERILACQGLRRDRPARRPGDPAAEDM